MKIALISETFLPQVNGAVKVVEQIVLHLERKGHEVLIITLGEGEKKYSKSEIIRIPGIKITKYQDLHIIKPKKEWIAKILNVDITQIIFSFLQSLIPNSYDEIGQALERFQPDLIHLVTPATLGSVGYYYAKKINIPCLATFHTYLASYADFYRLSYAICLVDFAQRQVYNRTDRVLVPSLSAKEQLEKTGIRNIGIFGRGVDNELFNPAKRNKQILIDYGLDPTKITIMYAGRIAEEKSLSTLVDAFKTLLRMRDNLQLLMVGDGPARSLLESQLINTPHCFAGFKFGEEFASLYASSDIFAFPSKTETFGQVVLEAMASGLPVLGFDSPGVSDLVKHCKTGYLAKLDDFEEFTNLLDYLVVSSGLREQFGKAALAEANSRSWDKVLDSLIVEYESLYYTPN